MVRGIGWSCFRFGAGEVGFLLCFLFFLGLVVDYYNERLYWVDVKFLVIGSIRFNGTDFIVVVDSKRG